MTKKSSPFIDVSKTKTDLRKKEPPLVSVQVTNPVTYLKSWWKRVMSKEGVDFRFRIKPLTAIGITIVIATFGFGVGKIVFTTQRPFVKYVPTTAPTPVPTLNPWRKTAFSGTLRFSGLEKKFYLLPSSSEAIKLEVLESVALDEFVGSRIFATGKFNQETRTLVVSEAVDLEILPERVESVPVVSPTEVVITPTETVIKPTVRVENNEDLEDSVIKNY